MTVAVGAGWQPLSEELAADLGRLDPPGELLAIEIDADGLPRFRVRLDRRVRAEDAGWSAATRAVRSSCASCAGTPATFAPGPC